MTIYRAYTKCASESELWIAVILKQPKNLPRSLTFWLTRNQLQLDSALSARQVDGFNVNWRYLAADVYQLFAFYVLAVGAAR